MAAHASGPGPKRIPDLDTARERFLVQLRADGRSKHTIAQYQRHLDLLARWAAQEGPSGDVAAIGHEALARFLASPVAITQADGRPKRAGTVNSLRTSVRGFFGYLHEAGYLAEDPSRLVRHAICGPAPPRLLSEVDQRRLLATLAAAEGEAGRRDHALFHLLLATGVRLGAALALDAADLDLDGGEALLRRSKGGRVERVFLAPALQEHLRRYLAGRTTGTVFARRDGRPITARHAHRRLAHWLETSGAGRVSPHGLRHAFALGLYRRTHDLLLVRRALGHRAISSTLRYARIQDDELRTAMCGGGR